MSNEIIPQFPRHGNVKQAFKWCQLVWHLVQDCWYDFDLFSKVTCLVMIPAGYAFLAYVFVQQPLIASVLTIVWTTGVTAMLVGRGWHVHQEFWQEPVYAPQENIALFLSQFGDIIGQATDEICASLDIALDAITELEVAWTLTPDQSWHNEWRVSGCGLVVRLDGLGAVLSCHTVDDVITEVFAMVRDVEVER